MDCRRCGLPVARTGNTTRIATTCECSDTNGENYFDTVACDYCGNEKVVSGFNKRDLRERVNAYINTHSFCVDAYPTPQMAGRTRRIGR